MFGWKDRASKLAQEGGAPGGLVRTSKGKIGRLALKIPKKMTEHGTVPSAGWFFIESALGPGLVLDVPFARTDVETKVWIYTKNGSDAQLVCSIRPFHPTGIHNSSSKSHGRRLRNLHNRCAQCCPLPRRLDVHILAPSHTSHHS